MLRSNWNSACCPAPRPCRSLKATASTLVMVPNKNILDARDHNSVARKRLELTRDDTGRRRPCLIRYNIQVVPEAALVRCPSSTVTVSKACQASGQFDLKTR
jgi:hypothetical protein